MKQGMADYHLHTTVSPDGMNTMEELCDAALEKGLEELAFTDHFEIYTPGFQGSKYSPLGKFTIPYLKQYRERFEQCQKEYGEKITLKSGIELGQPHLDPAFAQEVLRVMDFDFVLGSMHKVDDIDFSERDHTCGQNEALCRMNLENLYRLADEGDFDCLAHLDLIKRYAARQGQRVSLLDYPDELEVILKRLIERGKGIEINTSGVRQGMGETIPAFKILSLYRKLGGEILTIGSDAHKAADLGADFDIACQMAKEAGFSALARYTRRQVSFCDL